MVLFYVRFSCPAYRFDRNVMGFLGFPPGIHSVLFIAMLSQYGSLAAPCEHHREESIQASNPTSPPPALNHPSIIPNVTQQHLPMRQTAIVQKSKHEPEALPMSWIPDSMTS